MAVIYKEAGFPLDYREREVRQILTALYRLRSIAIAGLAGMGKSSITRFLLAHSAARSRYLRERTDDYAFVHLDCAGLAQADEAEILGQLAARLRRQGLAAEAGPAAGPPRQMLEDQVLALEPGLNVVLVLDYFDEAATRLERAFYNYLFHLRNARPRGNLCYILVTRRPLGPLYELQELLDDPCIVGPLGHRDALESLQRDEVRLGCSFAVAQREKLVACTGGHPGLLKNAAELLAGGQVDARLSAEEMAVSLLRSPKVVHLCTELWNDLTPEEQGVLLCAAQGLPLPASADGARVSYLERSGLISHREGRPQDWAVFGPLFASFVRGQAAGQPALHIAAVPPNRARLATATGEEWVTLPPNVFAVLLGLSASQGQVVPVDELIGQVYGSTVDGVSDAALAQLVKRLREALDPHARRLTGDPTYTCVETIRRVGYRLKG